MSLSISKPQKKLLAKRKSILGISPYWLACIPLVAIILVVSNTAAVAQDAAEPLTLEGIQGALNSTWVLIAAVGAFVVLFSVAAWFLIKLVFGLRVDLKDEIEGLDISEHGMEAYNGFVYESEMQGGVNPID